MVLGILACIFGFYFFFQAEDGIRDLTVTGVQTCALPISSPRCPPPAASPPTLPRQNAPCLQRRLDLYGPRGSPRQDRSSGRGPGPDARPKIGRASCRERV